MNILIVEPSITMRRIIKNTLIGGGFENVFEAVDGMDAIEKLKIRRIDCILTEWDMPNMSGLALIKSIRRNEDFKHIPVIMVTERGSRRDLVEAFKAQVNGYIVKPFNKPLLIQKVKELTVNIKNEDDTKEEENYEREL